MKKIFTLMAALMGVLTISAKTIYLVPNDWRNDGAVFFAHSWDAGDADAQMTTVSDNLYSVEIPDGNNHIIFVRMPNGSTSLDWSTKWNQTGDLEIPTGQNMYTITGWGDTDGSWSVKGDNPDPGQGTDPQPSGEAYWYWKGYVDGTELNNEMEGGIFYDGISEITVNDAGYIFVVYQEHGVPGVQYMTDGWQGTDITHATMNNCGTCNTGDKLYIPAGTYTLYLYDNGNGTVELSREPLPGKTLMGGGQGQGIEHTKVVPSASKVIMDGQLRIVHGDKIYDAMGREL